MRNGHAGCFYQKHGFHAHGWVFSRILYPCSAAHCLVLMRSRRNGLPRIFRMRRVVWENVTRWACLVCEKSVEIREICGRQLSAQCAKEQAECIYSPTDLSDKHRCHADCLSITQIAPSARQIDTDFSQAENLSMWARLTGTPEGAEVHSPAASEAAPWI